MKTKTLFLVILLGGCATRVHAQLGFGFTGPSASLNPTTPAFGSTGAGSVTGTGGGAGTQTPTGGATSPTNTPTGGTGQFLVATTPVPAGQPITVSWVVGPPASSFTDSILMFRRDGTNQTLAAQKYVLPQAGSTNFLADAAGTYEFHYIRVTGEYLLLSNPVVVTSAPTVLRLRALHNAGGILLSWNAKSNTTYRVLSSIDPARPTFEWQTEADVRAAGAGELQFTPSLSRIPRRFFLLREVP